MTNKEFQEILSHYPDDYTIQMDNSFGWETPTSKNKVDPHLYINSDFGFIEIEPPEIRDIWIKPEDALPDTYMECLIMTSYGVELVIYDFEGKRFKLWDYFLDCETKFSPEEVIAWMPIPKYTED